MVTQKWLALTESEKRIWEAAYAASYARLVLDEEHLRHQMNRGGIEEAIKAGHGEKAEYLADASIRELRRWRAEGKYPTDKTKGAPVEIEAQVEGAD